MYLLGCTSLSEEEDSEDDDERIFGDFGGRSFDKGFDEGFENVGKFWLLSEDEDEEDEDEEGWRIGFLFWGFWLIVLVVWFVVFGFFLDYFFSTI